MSYVDKMPGEAVGPVGDLEPVVAVAPDLHEQDIEGVRTAARWTMATSGAAATVLLAGFQFGDLAATARASVPMALASAALCLTAIVVILNVFRSAARVLVPDRITMDALLREESERRATQQGVVVGREHPSRRREAKDVIPELVDDIHMARGWLLPTGCSNVSDLQQRLRSAEGADLVGLNAAAARVMSFARMEVARVRYRAMIEQLTGWRGVLVVLCLVGLAGIAGLSSVPPPRVSEPLPVAVSFNDSEATRTVVGNCAGQTVLGVAVAGELRQPEVTFPEGRCGGMITVTEDLGVAVPQLD